MSDSERKNLFHRVGDAWQAFRGGAVSAETKGAELGRLFNIGTGSATAKLTHPYAKSAWVMSAIDAVVREVMGLNLLFSTQRRGGEALMEDPRLLQFWERPAQGMTRANFLKATGGSYKLWGEFFWVLDETWQLQSTDPARRSKLLWVKPDKMRHILRDDELVGWEWTVRAGKKVILLPDEVIHVKRWNPEDRWRGLGELDAAELAAEADFLQGRFAKNLAANNGDRSPILVAKSGMPTDDQQRQIVQALREKKRRAEAGEFHPTFLAGDIQQLDSAIQAVDANFTGQRIQNRHEVYAAFGVPMSMADVQASYSIGSASDRFRLIEGTCMPLADEICDAVEMVSARLLGQRSGTLYAWFNWMEHSTVRAVLKEFIDSATGLWDRGMSWQTINQWMQLGLPRFEGDEVGYLDFNRVPVGEMSDPATDAAYAETDGPAGSTTEDTESTEEKGGDDPVMRIALALRRRKQVRAEGNHEGHEGHEDFECGCGDGEISASERAMVEAFQKARDKKEVARWRALMAKRRGSVKDCERKFRRALMSARKETLAKIEAAQKLLSSSASSSSASFEVGDDGLLYKRGPSAHFNTKAAATDFIFDKESWKKEFQGYMDQAGRSALDAAAQQLLAEVGIDDPWTAPPHEVLSFLKVRENRLAGVADDVHQDVMDALSEGLNNGETLDQLAGRVRDTFNGIAASKARRIAQTETAAAYGKGRDIAMDQSGIEYKQWLTSGNDNVRASHAAANGQVRKLHEPFTVGGESLQYPGDSTGSAGNVINCHCVQIAVEKPEAEKMRSSEAKKPSQLPSS